MAAFNVNVPCRRVYTLDELDSWSDLDSLPHSLDSDEYTSGFGFTGSEPSVSVNPSIGVYPASGAIVSAGRAPTVTNQLLAQPGVGSITTTGFAPTATYVPNVNAAPGAGSIVSQGYAPTAADQLAVSIGAGAVANLGFAPTVSLVVAGRGLISWVSLDLPFSNLSVGAADAFPSVGSVVSTGYAPSVSLSAASNITPDAGAVTSTGYAPALSDGLLASPAAGAATLSYLAPSVTDQISALPGKGDVAVSGYAPAVSSAAAGEINIDAGAVVVTGFAPSLASNIVVFPDRGAGTFQGRTATISTTGVVAETPKRGARSRRRVVYRGRVYRSEDELKLALAIQESIEEQAKEISPKPKKKSKKAKPAAIVVESGEVKLDIPQVVFQSNAINDVLAQLDSVSALFADLAAIAEMIRRHKEEMEDEEDAIMALLMVA